MGIFKPLPPRLQRGHPLARGLVGAWEFGEGSGTIAYDSSGYGNHGIFTAIPVPTWGGGPAGSALQFDGTGSAGGYLSVAHQYGLTNAITFVASVNFNSLTGWQDFLGQNSSNSGWSSGSLYFQKCTNGTPGAGRVANSPGIIFPTSSSDGASGAYDPTPVVINKQYLFVATYDGQTLRFYTNGVQAAAVSRTGNIAPQAGNLNIGAGYYLSGVVDWLSAALSFVRIYNRALSAAEVALLYQMTGP
ncbi:MAG TPA: LamG domain-containing protein [Stellaceae bacterium]|nr:LamG domain-containing protein [Stellaceae bacterium]